MNVKALTLLKKYKYVIFIVAAYVLNKLFALNISSLGQINHAKYVQK